MGLPLPGRLADGLFTSIQATWNLLETSAGPALAQPWAGRVLSGAVTPDQVRSNAAAGSLRLPAGMLDELAALAQPPGEYWAARSRRAWS